MQFAFLTGTGTKPDGGLVLTVVVVLTTLHASRDILGRAALSPSIRLLSVPVVVLTAIGNYGVLFKAISTFIAGLTATETPTEMTIGYLVIGAFVLASLATELGWHRASKHLLQSLMVDDGHVYHDPLRLTAVIHAPVERVTEILRENEEVAALFDNGWISLTVLHPELENAAFHCQGDLKWESRLSKPLRH